MMQALGVHSTAELVRYAIEHRLIDGLNRGITSRVIQRAQ